MNKRCKDILNMLRESSSPLTASMLADHFNVSRQIIVGDVAILRASGEDIIATSRGYLLQEKDNSFPYIGVVFCCHQTSQLADELYTIVDLGGTVIDVTIEHAIYGELTGKLDLSSRYDVDLFLKRVSEEDGTAPICSLTGGFHLHRIGCRNRECFQRIHASLLEKGIAQEQDA